ncbi:MAG: DUF87 domain-containing protein [Chloroflexota bacterium]|jgi:hypothetical protein
MIETNGKYYLGKLWDPDTGKTADELLLYDSEDLTTHCVVVGMTGSGKTGLCFDLLEEAALNHVPALILDPKGDLTNLLLHFPDLSPSDFKPWINESEAKKAGKTPEEAAADTAEMWRNGLAGWGIEPSRLQALAESVQFTVYTPGSTAGVPLNILASLEAPPLPWKGNEEILGEQISGTMTALLSLTGMKDIDPVQSREHILLSNIMANAWSQGHNLDLGELIVQIQTPPFAKLGVFDVNTFFPEKDRTALAMRINSMLASPSFKAWMEGDPLDIQSLMYRPDGQPRHSIFYIAHLSDEERMFFVTLLYSAIETWMRAQSGTSSLRAIVYFDEISGYAPPVANPPSKVVMLRMLKQARAFGVGMVLATQNPVDLDYKGLSNAGTWFIGKLATERDKSRLIDGLISATAGDMDVKEYDRLISAIGKRVFVIRNVHAEKPMLFQTRWAMNYMAGPLTRAQIPAVNALKGAVPDKALPATSESEAASTSGNSSAAPSITESPSTITRPPVPSDVGEYFLPASMTLAQAAEVHLYNLEPDAQDNGFLYRPSLLAQTEVNLMNARYNLSTVLVQTALMIEPDANTVIRWEDISSPPVDVRTLDREPLREARFALLSAPLSDARAMRELESDFVDWVARNGALNIRANETLKVYAGPDVSDVEFEKMRREAAGEKMEAELKKLNARFAARQKTIEDKLDRAERKLEKDRDEYNRRKGQELMTHAETLIGLFGRRKKSLTSSMNKRGMTDRVKSAMQESEEIIASLKAELMALAEEQQAEQEKIKAKWEEIISDITEIPVSPRKTDIRVRLFGVAWLPHYLAKDSNGRAVEVPAFATAE